MEYTSQRKFNKYSGERKNLKEIKEMWKIYPRGLPSITRVVNKTAYEFVGFNLGVEIFFKKREYQTKGALK